MILTASVSSRAARAFGTRALLVAAAAFAVLQSPERFTLQATAGPIALENQLTGATDWDINGGGDPTIQGFATDISFNTGDTVGFKIQTDSTTYKIDIYRLGYYGGTGARKVATLGPFTQPQNQGVDCSIDPMTGLFDCGAWSVSASWPSTGAVSGIYIAKLTRNDTGGSSHIVFIVRDDARSADIVMQASDETWQAYNTFGGASLYCGGPVSNAGTAYACPGRAAKVSYNRPFDTRGHDPQSWVFHAEYPMLRFLEANGFDVKYQAGVDTDRRGGDLVGARKPKAFFSVGHDEYWSGNQRTMVESARDAGVHLAFFSGNEMFWKTRYEPSIDGSNTPYRTLVTYKETLASDKIDPAVDGSGNPIWTGAWRDARFSPPADGGRPENAVTGTLWSVNSGTTAITVPASMAGLRFWRNTRVAALTSGMATMSAGTLGYEWDEDVDNGSRPAGLVHLSSTTLAGAQKIVDYGASVGVGTATHALTIYRAASGALVFGAGTVQWAWGLDANHTGGGSAPDQAMQQATVNLLGDMGVQPATLQIGADAAHPLMATAASTDAIPPASVVTSPAAGAQVPSGTPTTISGTAVDSGGGSVAGVEVSVDGGATWHLAQGGAAWSYTWMPGLPGSATIRSRAIDDSGNTESPGPGVAVSIVTGRCPCGTIWDPSATPGTPAANDTNPVEVGVKFKSDIDGFVTGVRFFKAPSNTGTHLGNLWTIDGTRLASAVFASETPSGWQQVTFDTPVPITANTTYVASYHTNVGHYSSDGGYFVTSGVDSPPLHALPAAASGGDGLYTYGASMFPTHTFNGTNYWVDVVFMQSLVNSTALLISDVHTSVIDGSTAVITWTTNRDATSQIDYSLDPSFPPTPPGATLTQTDGTFVTRHSERLTGLTPRRTYYFRLTAIDHSGNFQLAMPPGFTLPGPTMHDTASADFAAGTQGSLCDASGACAPTTYVSETGDGEVILAPAIGSEFAGPDMPAGWIEIPWTSDGYAMVDGRALLVDGARVAACVTDGSGNCLGEAINSTPSAVYAAPRTLEFSAKFSGDHFQHAGFGRTLFSPAEPWAMFSTLSGDGQLYARTNAGGSSVDTPLGYTLLGAFHRFRIDWKATSVDYYVDGALVDSQAITVSGPMRPIAASDFDPFGGVVFVDWMRMTPYAAAGSFVSRVFDAAGPVDWASFYWTQSTPPGTSVALFVRTGNTPTPDGTWSAFAARSAPGAFSAHSQYVQYRVDLATTDAKTTPELSDVIISTDHAPVAVNDAAATNQDTSYTFAGPIGLTANDTDADGDALQITGLTQPAHGTVALGGGGSVVYTPAPGFNGDDRFTYTVSDGLLSATGTVAMTVGGGATTNSAPVAKPDAATVLEDSGANAINVMFNDVGESIAVTAVTQGAHGAVAFTASGVSYTPAANYNGADAFTYTIANTNGTASASVAVTVTPVNDSPSFTKGADQFAFKNSGLNTVAGWATALSAGPPDESAQTLSFIVSNDNAALFSTQPAVAPNGTLTFAPATNAVGTATVSVAVHDSGGTANGGVDTSAKQTFAITVLQGTTVTANFNDKPIAAGDFVWFNSVVKISGLGPANPVTIAFRGSISFTAGGTPYVVQVPNATITYQPGPGVDTTTFCNGQWMTTFGSGPTGNVFVAGLALQAPPGGFPRGIQNIKWQGEFFTVSKGIKLNWKWAAAVYHNLAFGSDYGALGVKPVDDGHASAYQNSDHAGTPENFKKFLVAGATGGGGSNFTGGYSGSAAPIPVTLAMAGSCGGS